MYAVVVTFQIAPGATERFLSLMMQNARTSRTTEPGCQLFDVCTDPERPDEVFLYEIYDDRAAFEAHTASAHYAQFQKDIDGMVAAKDVRFFGQVAR